MITFLIRFTTLDGIAHVAEVEAQHRAEAVNRFLARSSVPVEIVDVTPTDTE
jgi:hypothetical protein